METDSAQTGSTTWDGQNLTLGVNQNVVMPQTPNGTLIFGYANLASQNSAGQLSLTSGGNRPVFLDAPAGTNQPSIDMRNWAANDLSVTNTSARDDTPIFIAGYGPGIPGQNPLQLPIGPAVPLVTTQCAQGQAAAQYMQLVMQSTSPTLTIFGVVGGLPDENGTNGYVFAVNSGNDTGPGTGVSPPAGYYATTTSNTYQFPFNWGSSSVYVVNMSPSTAVNARVTLRKL